MPRLVIWLAVLAFAVSSIWSFQLMQARMPPEVERALATSLLTR